MTRGMLNGTSRRFLQGVIHVENLLFCQLSRHFLIEKMNIMLVMNDVLDLFN